MKPCVMGIDIGSVSAGYVILDGKGKIIAQNYGFHHGDIKSTFDNFLADISLNDLNFVAATASTPATVFANARYNNQVAEITAAKRFHPHMRALLMVGGEKFRLSTFSESGEYLGSTTNTSCAAGTGSFLDQQAGRLNLSSSENLSLLARSCNGSCPQIASRCSVFAKTDLIHAQQQGYKPEEISNGLCYGLAKNIVDTLCSRTLPNGEIIFGGGVAKNKAVTDHISKLLQRPVVVPAHGHLYGAYGAGLLLLADHKVKLMEHAPRSPKSAKQFFHTADREQRQFTYPPLRLQLSKYPEFSSYKTYKTSRRNGAAAIEVDIYCNLEGLGSITSFFGVDIGSTSTKAVLVDEHKNVLVGLYTRTAGNPLEAVRDIFFAIDEIEQKTRSHFVIKQAGTTGSGRKFIGAVIGADLMVDEITAHARAAVELCPEVDTILEIGGQDAKFTTLKNGQVTFSTMNSVCAAGTGSFIEEQAGKLGCPLDHYSERAEQVSSPLTSDRCTVFMERDINYLLCEGYAVDEVLAAALHSVRDNYLQKVATEKYIGKTILFQGATAKNRALIAAFEQRLEKPILVSKYCHLTGALGTALLLFEQESDTTNFYGIELYKQTLPLTNEICSYCANHCKISCVEIDGLKVAYGFLCGREYNDTGYVKKKGNSFDLLRERKKLLPKTRNKSDKNIPLTIGLPFAVHLVDDFSLWQVFFDLLGINTLSSENCDEAITIGKGMSQAEFCAPVTAMHGHVAWLLERSDYVFLPVYLENKGKESRRQYCYYTQFLPAITSCIDRKSTERVLRPVIKYLYTSFHTKIELYRMLQAIAPGQWNFFEIASAFDEALSTDQRYRQQLKDLFARQRDNRKASDIGVIFLGRPYNVLSPHHNCNIPAIFQNHGIDAAFQDMLTYDQDAVAAIKPLLEEIHWQHAATILEAAMVTAATDGLYPVLLTSFKCAPDSFTIDYFKKIMEQQQKPYLILSLDDHGSNVGYETRIEAAIRSFRNHRESQLIPAPPCYTKINPRPAGALTGKHVLFPNWDHITCTLLTAALQREGYDAHLLLENEQTIRASLRHNSGQCIPLNAIAETAMACIRNNHLDPANCVLWLNKSYLGCNIRLYPHHIGQIFQDEGRGMENIAIYQGEITFSDISITAAKHAYFAFMLGGLLQKMACKIRPYEIEKGRTDKILAKSIKVLADAFRGKRAIDKTLEEIVTQFAWIETTGEMRPKVAIFGDLYSRDNQVMNQDLVKFIESCGGEVVTTPYSEYAKMVAGSYFRKWFNEGKYLDIITGKAILAAMTVMEKSYFNIVNRILDEKEFTYDDNPADILAKYHIAAENTGESMDNIIKIHYLIKKHPDLTLLVQASPALCCASLVTEAMKKRIEEITGVPVVSITYDGTGGMKNEIITPYLQYPRVKQRLATPIAL